MSLMFYFYLFDIQLEAQHCFNNASICKQVISFKWYLFLVIKIFFSSYINKQDNTFRIQIML